MRATIVLALAGAASALTYGFPYGSQKIRGVNLGGWLVLEPWITPSIFDNTGDSRIVDEYTIGQYANRTNMTAILTNHWNTWITETDFINIANAGLNHVRLPIGYWAWDVSGGEPYIQGQLPYLTKAITWGQAHGVKVLIDLHGAPGSQNGFDNSGQRGTPAWQTSQSFINRTDDIIKTIASQYANMTSVVSAIGALNEPRGTYSSQLLTVVTQYWHDSYGNIRYPFGTSTQGNTLVVIHDAFEPLSHWDGFMDVSSGHQGVMMDTHIYQMFSQSGVAQNNTQHLQTACNYASTLSAFTSLWLVVGEWTTAMTDCATYLNGRGNGARYDGTLSGSTKVGSCTGLTGATSSFSSAYKTFLRQTFEAQTSTFEANAQGWIMWTWKTESADEWSYSKGLAGGWIPSPPTVREYPNICS